MFILYTEAAGLEIYFFHEEHPEKLEVSCGSGDLPRHG